MSGVNYPSKNEREKLNFAMVDNKGDFRVGASRTITSTLNTPKSEPLSQLVAASKHSSIQLMAIVVSIENKVLLDDKTSAQYQLTLQTKTGTLVLESDKPFPKGSVLFLEKFDGNTPYKVIPPDDLTQRLKQLNAAAQHSLTQFLSTERNLTTSLLQLNQLNQELAKLVAGLKTITDEKPIFVPLEKQSEQKASPTQTQTVVTVDQTRVPSKVVTEISQLSQLIASIYQPKIISPDLIKNLITPLLHNQLSGQAFKAKLTDSNQQISSALTISPKQELSGIKAYLSEALNSSLFNNQATKTMPSTLSAAQTTEKNQRPQWVFFGVEKAFPVISKQLLLVDTNTKAETQTVQPQSTGSHIIGSKPSIYSTETSNTSIVLTMKNQITSKALNLFGLSGNQDTIPRLEKISKQVYLDNWQSQNVITRINYPGLERINTELLKVIESSLPQREKITNEVPVKPPHPLLVQVSKTIGYPLEIRSENTGKQSEVFTGINPANIHTGKTQTSSTEETAQQFRESKQKPEDNLWIQLSILQTKLEKTLSLLPDSLQNKLKTEAAKILSGQDLVYSPQLLKKSKPANAAAPQTSAHTQTVENMLQITKAALSRIQLNQLAGVVNQLGDNTQFQSVELPLVLPGLEESPKIEYRRLPSEEDKNSKELKQKEKRWHVRFHIHWQPMPPCCTDIYYGNGPMDIQMWSESQTFLNLTNRFLPDLKETLSAKGFDVREIVSRFGLPKPKPRISESEHLVDIST